MAKRLVLKKLSNADRIAWLTLNRSEKKNALSNELMNQLIRDLKEISENKDVRVIVLSATGDSFCSGLDLYDLRKAYQRERRWGEGGSLPEILHLLRTAPQITIAAVQGYCLGGGLVLSNGCDLAVAADTAKFGMPEILRGSYGAVATPTLFHSGLPNKVAFYISLTGRNLSGVEAARVGLVSQVVPEKDLKQTVKVLATEIASCHRVALAHAKIAAYVEQDVPFLQAMQADELISHRQSRYINPFDDVKSFLKSQKRRGGAAYKNSDAK